MIADRPKPTLLLFAACERVVIGGEDDNSASLIAILQGFTIQTKEIPKYVKGAPPTAFPLTWYAFALWENDFSGLPYHQRLILESPNGNVLLQQDGEITFAPDKRFNRLNVKVAGFPIDGIGDYKLRLLSAIHGQDFQERAVFPIPVKGP